METDDCCRIRGFATEGRGWFMDMTVLVQGNYRDREACSCVRAEDEDGSE